VKKKNFEVKEKPKGLDATGQGKVKIFTRVYGYLTRTGSHWHRLIVIFF
jgi:hypothetical protein